MIKAPRLQPGDTIGIVSPSWGGPAVFPHRVDQGVAQLRALGYQVMFAPHARNQAGYISDTPTNRAADIHALFADPTVKAIIASIGGDHSCQLLPHLDFDLIAANPKIFVGYSDITVLNVAIWQATGLVTFNGPTLIAEFGEYPELLDYTRDYFQRAVASDQPIGLVEPAPSWTDELLDWGKQRDRERPRLQQTSHGWVWGRAGKAEGPLIGGCIESLQHLRGTRFWPNMDGALLFLESGEEHTDLARLDGILMDYENMGVFAQIAGLLVGRPMRYSADERRQWHDLVQERTRGFAFPVVLDIDFGHTSPMVTLPLGCRARIDDAARRLEILEPGVR